MTTLLLQLPHTSQTLQLPDCRSDDIKDTLYNVLQHLDRLASDVTSSGDPFASAGFSRWLKDLEKLRDLLLTPEQLELLAATPEGSHLTIVGDLHCQRIPWETLPVQSQALGLRFAVGRRLQSSAPAAAQPANSLDPDRPLTGTGCVPTADSWQLISVDLEQRIVERRLRALLHSPHRLSPLNAAPLELTVADFSRILSENSWVHFAGHAVPGPDGQPARELVLATSRSNPTDYSTYPLSQLRNLPKVPRVLFLNSCAALQLPDVSDGPEPASLTSLLLQRGVEVLIGPVVRVADSASRHLVAAFYDALATRVSVGEALRQARLAATPAPGPQAALPTACVLYGRPDFIPFPDHPDSQSAAATDPSTTTAATVKSAVGSRPTGAPFPCPCARCGTLIRTRHGVYGQQPASTTPDGHSVPAGPLCRNCARETPSDPPTDTPAAGSARTPLPLPTPPRTDAEQLFCEWLEETLLREWPCRIPDRTQPALCRFTKPNTGPAHLPASAPVACLEIRELTDEQSRLIETAAVVLLRTETPATAEILTPLLQELAQLCPAALLVIAAPAGFSDTLLQQFQQPQPPAWQPVGSAIIFWEPASRTEHRRRLDLRSLMFPALLCRRQTHLQVATAVTSLSQLLPLATSFSAPQLALEWNLEIDAVEQALQLIALQHHLILDRHPEYGLVISPTDLQVTASSHASRPAPATTGSENTDAAQPEPETWLQRLKIWRK